MVLITCLIDDPWLAADVGTLKCLLPVLVYWSFWSYRWHTQNIKLKTAQWRHIWGQGWQTPLPRLGQSSALSDTGQGLWSWKKLTRERWVVEPILGRCGFWTGSRVMPGIWTTAIWDIPETDLKQGKFSLFTNTIFGLCVQWVYSLRNVKKIFYKWKNEAGVCMCVCVCTHMCVSTNSAHH